MSMLEVSETTEKELILAVKEGSKVKIIYQIPVSEIPDVEPIEPCPPGQYRDSSGNCVPMPDQLQVVVKEKVFQVSEANQQIVIDASATVGAKVFIIKQTGGLPKVLETPVFGSVATVTIPTKDFFRITFQVQAWDYAGNYDQEQVFAVPAEACPAGQHRDPVSGLCVIDQVDDLAINFHDVAMQVQPGQSVTIMAHVKGNVQSYTLTQSGGTPAVSLNKVSDYVHSFIMPDTKETLEFKGVVAEINTTKTAEAKMTVKKIPGPEPSGKYPINFVEWYNSTELLAQGNKKLTSSKYEIDGVCLPSGASGAKNHQIVDGWVKIDSGGGNGRIYWDFHRSKNKTIEQDPNFGSMHCVGGTFIRGPKNDNLSVKIGNHGSDGRELDGKMVFGGFGFSLHTDEAQSKVEYWHNYQGKEVAAKYPGGKKLDFNKEYKFFACLMQNKEANTAVLNIWVDWNAGAGYELVMKDRQWNKSDWSPGKVPNGEDKADILEGPGGIKCHCFWTRANVAPCSVKDIIYGIPVTA